MCTKARQIGKQIWKIMHILWSIDLGENSRACSHSETDTEKTPPRTTRPPKDWRLAKEHWNDRHDSSPTTTQDLPKYFSLTCSLIQQLLLLFHETLYIELCILILAAWSQVFRFALALLQGRTKTCSLDHCGSTCPPGEITQIHRLWKLDQSFKTHFPGSIWAEI